MCSESGHKCVSILNSNIVGVFREHHKNTSEKAPSLITIPSFSKNEHVGFIDDTS